MYHNFGPSRNSKLNATKFSTMIMWPDNYTSVFKRAPVQL